MDTLDEIRAEARQIVQAVATARRDHPNGGRSRKPTSAAIGDIARELGTRPPHLSPYDTPLDAYMLAIKYWAQRAAPQITFKEWQQMADDMGELFGTEFAGHIDPVSFLENLFDGTTTKDGVQIWA